MAKIKRHVSIQVSPMFFERVFEPNRKKFERMFNVKMTQPRFTEYIARVNAKIVIPKKNRRGGFKFNLGI